MKRACNGLTLLLIIICPSFSFMEDTVGLFCPFFNYRCKNVSLGFQRFFFIIKRTEIYIAVLPASLIPSNKTVLLLCFLAKNVSPITVYDEH